MAEITQINSIRRYRQNCTIS